MPRGVRKYTGKRKAYRNGRVVKRRRIQPAQKGYLRTGGFYGRYANGGEKKFFDTDLDAIFTTVANTMEQANLNIIVQGNTESNRVGRKVILTRVDCRGILTLPASTASANTSGFVRMLLVCDKQTNGSAFAATDLWETDAWGTFNNLSNSSRFQILQSKIFTMNSPSGSGRGSTDTLAFGEKAIAFKMGVDLNLPIEFDNSATTGAVTTQRSNSLWLVTQGAGTGVLMSTAQSRVRFSDG